MAEVSDIFCLNIFIRITHSRCRPRGALTCIVHLQSKLKDVGNIN